MFYMLLVFICKPKLAYCVLQNCEEIIVIESADWYAKLCVRGSCMMDGYYKDPEQTKQSIQDDGWVHTGDVGQWLPVSNVYVLWFAEPFRIFCTITTYLLNLWHSFELAICALSMRDCWQKAVARLQYCMRCDFWQGAVGAVHHNKLVSCSQFYNLAIKHAWCTCTVIGQLLIYLFNINLESMHMTSSCPKILIA